MYLSHKASPIQPFHSDPTGTSQFSHPKSIPHPDHTTQSPWSVHSDGCCLPCIQKHTQLLNIHHPISIRIYFIKGYAKLSIHGSHEGWFYLLCAQAKGNQLLGYFVLRHSIHIHKCTSRGCPMKLVMNWPVILYDVTPPNQSSPLTHYIIRWYTYVVIGDENSDHILRWGDSWRRRQRRRRRLSL